MKILAAQINPTIGDLKSNGRKVKEALRWAKEKGIQIVVFPELTLSGYFPYDLLLDRSFIESIEHQLEEILPETKGLFAVIGLPRTHGGKGKPLYNSAAICIDGKRVGYQDKVLLPTYDVFEERRYFEPGGSLQIWEYQGKKIAVLICEDVWQHTRAIDGYTDYARDPIEELQGKKIDLLLNLSGSPYYFQRAARRMAVFRKAAQDLGCPVVFCNQVGANDQIVFDGRSFFLDAQGALQKIAKGFSEDRLVVDWSGKTQAIHFQEDSIADLYAALVLGVKDYFRKQGFTKAVLGLSGGIDSALVACIAKDALGAQNILALSLPSRFSSKGSVEDAQLLAQKLGIELKSLSIEPIFNAYSNLLEPFFPEKLTSLTTENIQARIRGMILMAFSNQNGSLLLNTSNKSELAMGYATLYGDMAGGLGVLQDVSKLQVYRLAKYIQSIPDAILQKPPSAELRENQTDAQTLPPYETLDPILEGYIEKRLPLQEIAKEQNVSLDLVQKVVQSVHRAEYKRRQAPIGIRVTPKAFSKGRIVPIVQNWI